MSAARLILLDPYHAGVRVATLGWWLASSVGLFAAGLWLIGQLLGGAGSWFILPWLIGVLFGSQYLGRWGERFLMRRWSSGRTLELAGPRLTLREPAGAQVFDLSRKVSHWRWGFAVRERRGGRVPNGHLCCALRLVQAGEGAGPDVGLTVYTFLAPAEAEALRARYPYYELRRPSDAPLPAGALGGRDPLWLANEKARWDIGAEMEAPDWQALSEHLARHLPDFAQPLAG